MKLIFEVCQIQSLLLKLSNYGFVVDFLNNIKKMQRKNDV